MDHRQRRQVGNRRKNHQRGIAARGLQDLAHVVAGRVPAKGALVLGNKIMFEKKNKDQPTLVTMNAQNIVEDVLVFSADQFGKGRYLLLDIFPSFCSEESTASGP